MDLANRWHYTTEKHMVRDLEADIRNRDYDCTGMPGGIMLVALCPRRGSRDEGFD